MYKVLIVDDEYLIREGLSESISWEKLGYKVSGTARNGQEALDIMSEEPADIIITDVKMPVMDGITLCSIINKKYPKTKIIILSGYGEFEYAKRAIEYNVYSYILKPLNEDELVSTFGAIFNELQTQNMPKDMSEGAGVFEDANTETIEHIFLELLSGKPEDENFFTNKLIKLGLDPHNKYFCIIAFNYDTVEEITESRAIFKEILQVAKEYWGEIKAPSIYLNGTFYVVLHAKNHISRADLNHYINGFLDYIKQNASSHYGRISMGVGREFKNLSTFKDKTEEANIALGYKYYRGEGSRTFYNDIYSSTNGSGDLKYKELVPFIEDISKGLLSCNTSMFLTSIKKLFNYFSQIGLDINHLYVKFIRIYSSIVDEIKKEHLFIPIPTEEEFYKAICKSRTFRMMTQTFEEILLSIQSQIKDYNETGSHHLLIQKIKQYITNNANSDLSLDQLSSIFFMNSSYLSKIFKDECRENLSDYIQKVRIEQAKNLLESTNKKVQEIATKVGYGDYRYFCTVFKKATGLTPLQYRVMQA